MARCLCLSPILLAFLFLHPTLAHAERILLKDGRVLRADGVELLPGGRTLRLEEGGRRSDLAKDEVLAVFPESGQHLSRPRRGPSGLATGRSPAGYPATPAGGGAAAGSPAGAYGGITERMVDGVRRQLEEALRPRR